MKRHFAFFMAGCIVPVFFVAAALPGQAQDLTLFFPDIAGWQKKGAAETYSPENLYEYIDGAAENFLNYDFKQLAVQNYTNKQNQFLSAEIYFHGTAENAFGIYSSEKPLFGKYFKLGSQGYAEAGILNFLCSAYYVKLNGFELGRNSRDILATLGRAIVRKIGARTALPKILKAFPESGKIANSERFIRNNFLGHDFLHAAYVADYRVKGQNFQLFIINTGSEEEARTMLEKYAALEKENPLSKIQPGALTINDPYNGPSQLFWSGTSIRGVVGQTPAAAAYLQAINEKLKKQ
jgi:hypothetical protein